MHFFIIYEKDKKRKMKKVVLSKLIII